MNTILNKGRGLHKLLAFSMSCDKHGRYINAFMYRTNDGIESITSSLGGKFVYAQS